MSVVKNLQAPSMKQSFVVMLVSLDGGENKDMTMKQEFVNTVEKNLQQTNTLKLEPVQEVVQIKTVKIKRIIPDGIEDVYNMEVEDHHNFSVNGGFIVHNCLDALRYACERFSKNTKIRFTDRSRLF